MRFAQNAVENANSGLPAPNTGWPVDAKVPPAFPLRRTWTTKKARRRGVAWAASERELVLSKQHKHTRCASHTHMQRTLNEAKQSP